MYDWQINNVGSIKLDNFQEAGDLTITKKNGQFYKHGYINDITVGPNNEFIETKRSVDDPMGNVDPAMAVSNFNSALANQANDIINFKKEYAMKHGEKNIQNIINK